MGAEEWEFVIEPEPTTDSPPASTGDRLDGDNISVTLGDSGYGRERYQAAIIDLGDGLTVVVSRQSANSAHIQTYGKRTDMTVENLSSGRNDLGKPDKYVRIHIKS